MQSHSPLAVTQPTCSHTAHLQSHSPLAVTQPTSDNIIKYYPLMTPKMSKPTKKANASASGSRYLGDYNAQDPMLLYSVGDLQLFLNDNIFSRLMGMDGNIYMNLIPAGILDKVMSEENMRVFLKAFTYRDFSTYADSYESLKIMGDYLCSLFMASKIQEELKILVYYTRIQHEHFNKYNAYYKSNKVYGHYLKQTVPEIGKFIRKRGNIVNPEGDIPDDMYTDIFAALMEAIVITVDSVVPGFGIPIADKIFNAIMVAFRTDPKVAKGSAKAIITDIFNRLNAYPPKGSGIAFDNKVIIVVTPEAVVKFNEDAHSTMNKILPISRKVSTNALPELQERINRAINDFLLEKYPNGLPNTQSSQFLEGVRGVVEEVYPNSVVAVGFGGTRPTASDEAYKNLLDRLSNTYGFTYENYILIHTKKFIDRYDRRADVEKKMASDKETLRFVVKNGEGGRKNIELIAHGTFERLVHSIEVENDEEDKINAKKELLKYYINGGQLTFGDAFSSTGAKLAKAKLRNLMVDIIFAPVKLQSVGTAESTIGSIVPRALLDKILSDANMDILMTAWTHQSASNYEGSYQGMETMGDHRCNYFCAKRNRECLELYETKYATTLQDRAIKLDSYYRSNRVFMEFLVNAVDAKYYIRGKFAGDIVPEKVYSDVLEALIEAIFIVVETVQGGLGMAVAWNAFRAISRDYTPDVKKHSRGTPKSIITEIFEKNDKKDIGVIYTKVGGSAWRAMITIAKSSIKEVNKEIEGVSGLKQLPFLSVEAVAESKDAALDKTYDAMLAKLKDYNTTGKAYYDAYYKASQDYLIKMYSRKHEIYQQNVTLGEFIRIVKKKSHNKDMYVWELVVYHEIDGEVRIGESIEVDYNPTLWHAVKKQLLEYYLDVYPIRIYSKSEEIAVKELETNRLIKFRRTSMGKDKLELISYTTDDEEVEVLYRISVNKDPKFWHEDQKGLLSRYLSDK